MLNVIKSFIVTGIIATIVAFTMISSATANEIRIGAMREGTSWYVFAATLEQIIEPIFGANTVEIIARGGGVANPMVVQGGKAEIALSNVATAVWAYKGHPSYQGASAPDIRALVGGLNNVYVGAMVRQAFIKERGTNDLAKLLTSDKPVKLLMKPVGSSAVPTAMMILESLGTDIKKIKANGGDVIQVGAPQIPDLLRDGKADIYIDTVIKGHPTISEVSLTADVKFLDLPEASIKLLEENGLQPGEYGPWFKGQDGPNKGANLGTVLIANKSLDDETAYKITKALIENAGKLAEAHAAWSQFKPEEAWKPQNTGRELHPGAVRSYKERGWM